MPIINNQNNFWLISRLPGDCGFVDYELHLPGIYCSQCGKTWSGTRHLPLHVSSSVREIVQSTYRKAAVVPVEQFFDICSLLGREGVQSPFRDEPLSSHYYGFSPGDCFGNAKWKDSVFGEWEFCCPYGTDGMISSQSLVNDSLFSSFEGFWLAEVSADSICSSNCYSIYVDPMQIRLPKELGGWKVDTCSYCHRPTSEVDIQRKIKLNAFRKRCLRARILPRSLVPNNQDAFYTLICSGYFVSERLYKMLSPFIRSSSTKVQVERWTTDDVH